MDTLKSGVVVVLILGSCFADITTWSDDRATFNHKVDNFNSLHYSQHEASVNAARKGAADRLARISSTSGANACGTTLCYSNSGFSDNSDAETVGQGIVGFSGGTAGSSSSSAKYQTSSHHESAKTVVPVYPVASEGSKSSYFSSSQRHSTSSSSGGGSLPLNYIPESEGVKTRSNFGASSGSVSVQPIVASGYPIGQDSSHSSFSSVNRDTTGGQHLIPVDTGSAYRTRSSYSAASERETASLSRPVSTVHSSGDQSSKYSAVQDSYQRYPPSNTYVMYSKPIPVHVYTPVSSPLDSSARFAGVDSTGYAPIHVPVGSSGQHSNVDEQQSYSAVSGSLPQPVYGSSLDRSSHTSSGYRSGTSASYRPVYQPVYSSHSSGGDRASESDLRSTDTLDTYGLRSTASSNHLEDRQEDYTRKGSTYVPIATSSGSSGSSKYATHDESHTRSGPVYVPVVPVGGVQSESQAKYASQDRRHHSSSYTPVVVQPVAGTSTSSASSQYSGQQHRHRHGSYYPAAGSSSGLDSRYSASDSQNAFNQQRFQGGGGFVPYPITGDSLGRQFGSGGLSFSGADNDLSGIMSESERLAKLQAKNTYNGAVAGSSAIDVENRFDGSSDAAASNPAGYKRTKSWSSSSKWASGQKYGDDGKIKSYNSLSTAESEQHNIDGKKTGYKAATTTLDDDGKVSTYSLHTP